MGASKAALVLQEFSVLRDETLTPPRPSVRGLTRAWRRLIGPRTSERRGGGPALGLNVNGDKAFYDQIFMNGCVHPCSCFTPVANWQLHLRLREQEGGNDGEPEKKREKS